jgi:hypothetical protein
VNAVQEKEDLRPSNSLTQRFHTSQNTGKMAQVRKVRRILANQPIEKLLESLTTELPEENKRIALSKAALEPIKYWRL